MEKRQLKFFSRQLILSWIVTLLFLPAITIASAQDGLTVKGKVTDAQGNPVPMASVVVKGTSVVVMSDSNGNYTVTIPKNVAEPVLQFSFVGFNNAEAIVNQRTLVDVTLSEDVSTLDEVVVVGYGVQKKSVVTAAISKVTSDDLELVTPTRIEDVLKGKVSGVQIIQDSGQPNSGSRVRVRGTGTINNSNPLYIVDGMPVGGGISYLNPTDIESVEVLKDAASAAIYGTRGANGVLLITTKQGAAGRTSLNYDFSYGWQNPWKKKAVLDAKEYMVIQNEMAINDGGAPRYTLQDIANAKTTDWQDETFNYNAPVRNHQVSINGGNERNRYFLSFGYFNHEGIVGGNVNKSNYERYSVRLNDTYTVLDATNERKFLNKVRIGTNIAYSRAKSSSVETNSEWGSILGSAITLDPSIPVLMTKDETAAQLALPTDAYPYNFTVLNEDGLAYTTPPPGFQEIGNPVGMLHQPNSSIANEDKFVSTVWGEIEIYDGLKFRSSYGTDLAFWGNDSYSYPYFLSVQGKWLTQENSNVQSEMNRGFTWQVENFFSYDKTFNRVHSFSAVLGQSAMKNSSKNLGGNGTNIPTTDPNKAWINNTIGGALLRNAWGGIGDVIFQSLASYFFRFNYNYDERYMFQASVRRDGSSRFGTNNKWATFPSVSVGWNVLNEPYVDFLKTDWFNVFKIRISWGKNGNENIGDLRYAAFDETGKNYFFGGRYHVGDGNWAGDATTYSGTYPSYLANPSIRWEESKQTDIGVDLRFFSSALNVSVDYFSKKTNGMLMTVPIPWYVGQGAPTGNVGTMENYGVEFEAGWKGKIKDFKYYINANASYVKNRLIDIGNSAGELYYDNNGASGVGSYVKASNGDVFPYFYGLKTNGLFQNQTEIDAYTFTNSEGVTRLIQPNAMPGDVRFVDLNGDGQINDDDKTKIGKPMPDWTYGITLGGEWRGFDFNLFFQGTAGNDMFEFAQRGDIPRMNRPEWILQRWHGEGTSDRIPRMTSVNGNQNWRSSDLYVKNGAYLRLKTAQFGYTLPANLTKRLAIQRLRLFVAAENLLTLTGYDGFDPEIAGGIDRGIYPQSRTVSIGFNVSF